MLKKKWLEPFLASFQHREYGRMSRKYSSCSTIFIDDSTVSQPNLKNTIRAVALAIYFHIRNRVHRDHQGCDDGQLEIFDETKHQMSVSIQWFCDCIICFVVVWIIRMVVIFVLYCILILLYLPCNLQYYLQCYLQLSLPCMILQFDVAQSISTNDANNAIYWY